jgi:hypothetical protein
MKAFSVETDIFRPGFQPVQTATYDSPQRPKDIARSMRHPDITDEMIKRNPFVFALN